MGSLDADLLTAAEVEGLLRACSSRAATGIRNRAVIAICWRCGLRISEALSLKAKDVDFDSGLVTVQHGKNDKRRVVAMDAGTAALVERWMHERRLRDLPAGSPIFCTLKGASVDPSYFRHCLPRLARRAGIEKRTHMHGLRHRHAVDLVEEGAPLTTIRDLLGHSSAATTSRYLTRIGAGEALRFARERRWEAPRT